MPDGSALPVDPYDLARAEAMITGYHYRWGDVVFEVLAIEAEYRAPLVNPLTGAISRTWQRGGKLDVLLRESILRRIVFMEHKTTSEDIRPGSDYWRKLHIDGQVSGYFIGAAALGFPAEACIYDVLKKPAHRPLTAKSVETPDQYRARILASIAAAPDAYYQRGEIVRLEAEASEALYDDWETALAMHESERNNRFPRNPDACFRFNRPCQFWDVCTGVASLEDERRFRRGPVNPELEGRGGLPVLSHSRLTAARRCARYHKLRYIDGYQSVAVPEPLFFGTLIHRGLEAWWRATGDERLEAALAALRGG